MVGTPGDHLVLRYIGHRLLNLLWVGIALLCKNLHRLWATSIDPRVPYSSLVWSPSMDLEAPHLPLQEPLHIIMIPMP